VSTKQSLNGGCVTVNIILEFEEFTIEVVERIEDFLMISPYHSRMVFSKAFILA